MTFDANSRAAAVGVGVKNVQFAPGSELVQRKVLVIGSYDDSTYTSVAEEVPIQVTSPEDAGNRFGFGYMIHRLVKAVWAGSGGLECWVVPQAETSAQAAGNIAVTGPATENGTLHLYIAGDYVPVSVTSGDAATAIATAIGAAINADSDLPVTASVTDDDVTVTSKSEGTWGNEITITSNEGFGQETPAGVAVVVTDMSSGAGTPTISDALDALGTDDDANLNYFTDVVHGYLQDSTTLDAISTYNGLGNDYVGCYSKLVGRPFRCLTGDTATGSGGLSSLTTLGGNRKTTDRTNGVIAVPGSPNHPSEIAAIAIGVMAKLNNNRAEENYNGQLLPGVIAGAAADRWTSSYDSRDSAVKAGVSPTKVDSSGAVFMQNVLTFYHPDNVPTASNGYAAMRNISILQNVLYNIRLNFEQEKWQGITIVSDVAKVANSVSKDKARDVSAVLDDLIALAEAFEERAWIYTASWTIEKLKDGLITVKDGGIGFDATLPIILSGNATIIDVTTQFDTSLAVLSQ